MTVAGYVRISLDVEDGTSPARQRADIAKQADVHGRTVERWYEDLSRSAYTGATRDDFERLLDDLPTLDVLYVWKLDRLIRHRRDLPRLADAMETHNVTLVSVNEGQLGGGPHGHFMLGLLANLGELESRTTSLRVSSAMKHLAESGRFHGGRRPYGYQPVPAEGGGKKLVIDRHEQAIALEVTRRVIGGESLRAICWDLTARGETTTAGNPWTSRTLGRTLRNPMLAGQQLHQRQPVRDDDGMPAVVREPVIDTWTWRRLQGELELRRTRKGPQRRKGSTLLGGMVRCGHCDGPMSGWRADTEQAQYACDGRRQHGPNRCPGNSINRRKLDTMVSGLLLRDWATRPLRPPEPARDDGLRDKVAALEQALDTLEYDRQMLGLYHGDEARYAARWRAYSDELADLRSRQVPARSVPLDTVPSNLPEVWATMGPERQRQVMLACLHEVVVWPREPAAQKRFDPDRVGKPAWSWELT